MPLLVCLLSLLLFNSCSTIGQSALLGAASGGAVGFGIGVAAERSPGSALIGLGAGALFGTGLGFLAHREKEERGHQTSSTPAKNDERQPPSISTPQIRRVWIPEKIIDGSRYEEGHWIWMIEKPALWRKP